MDNVYFYNVDQIGNLQLDYVFYRFEGEPILFTCIDEKKQVYLCLCSEMRGYQKWMIAQCDRETLRRLIEQKIDLTTAFLNAGRAAVVEMDLQGKEKSETVRTEEIDELDLPEKGTLLRCDPKAAREYLQGKSGEIEIGWWKEKVENKVPDPVWKTTQIQMAMREALASFLMDCVGESTDWDTLKQSGKSEESAQEKRSDSKLAYRYKNEKSTVERDEAQKEYKLWAA